MLDKLGRTLELLYAYNVSNRFTRSSGMMKMVVRRTVTTGVGYVKLGFERVMEQRPDMEKGIADALRAPSTMERLSADMADDITDADSKEAEQLRLLIEDMSKQVEFVTREGLMFDYPLPTNIIPDTKTIEIRNLLGADWVAEEYVLSPHEIQEIYGVDVSENYTSLPRADEKRGRTRAHRGRDDGRCRLDRKPPRRCATRTVSGCVWQIYCRKDGLVYEVCEGYQDFLREPASPEIYNERFYPWYALIFNECDHESEIFPPSDVRLMMRHAARIQSLPRGPQRAAHRGAAFHRSGRRSNGGRRPQKAQRARGQRRSSNSTRCSRTKTSNNCCRLTPGPASIRTCTRSIRFTRTFCARPASRKQTWAAHRTRPQHSRRSPKARA